MEHRGGELQQKSQQWKTNVLLRQLLAYLERVETMPNLLQKENNITVILWFRTQITAFTVKSYWETYVCKLTAHAFQREEKLDCFIRLNVFWTHLHPWHSLFITRSLGTSRFWSSHSRRPGQLSCSSEGLSGHVHQPGNVVAPLHFYLSPIAVVGSYHFCFNWVLLLAVSRWKENAPTCAHLAHPKCMDSCFSWVFWFSDWNQNQTFPRAGVQTVWSAGSLLVNGWTTVTSYACLITSYYK